MSAPCPECRDTGCVEMCPGGFATGDYWTKCLACGLSARQVVDAMVVQP